MSSKLIYSVFVFLIFTQSCKKSELKNTINSSENTFVSYTEDQSNFSNPERGFYGQLESGSGTNALDPLTKITLDGLKAKNITMVRRLYSMTTFRNSSISNSFLEHIQKDMDVVRANGFKIILRFAYTFNEPEPWNDAPESVILAHIEQLKPILQNNVDVIAMMEAGFIGRWGEWHTSSNKLDKMPHQKNILFKLLETLPKSRAVLVRTQQYKKNIFGKSEALNESEAFSQSNIARTGHHNDCFLASDDDWGTYFPFDSPSLELQKKYLNQENKFVPQEGETCNCNSPRSDCASAVKELANLRWSGVNKDYIGCVLDSWVNQGCYTEIAKKLGYRFRLINAEIPKSINTESTFNVKFKIKNDGFASPYNAHTSELVFRNKATGNIHVIDLKLDIRKWLPDLNEIDQNINLALPKSIPSGEYDLFLHFADPEPSLRKNPAYAIRLANQNTWEASTGYNFLQASVVVK